MVESSWLITLPKTIKWEDYEEELTVVEDGGETMFYKTPFKPRAVAGDKVYTLWNGKVRGWMVCTGVIYKHEEWSCSTTAVVWGKGWYIMRSGPFHKVDGPAIKGFRGIRRFKEV